jgi:hypothetical protein
MNVQDLTNGIIDGINGGGEQFLEGTLAAALPILYLAILALHLGRPYMLGMMSKFTLRLGADLLWMIYAGARDFLIVTAFVMSFMYFFPDVTNENSFPVTGGIAACFLFATLLVKLVTKGDDNDAQVYTITSFLLAVGTLTYMIPYLLGTQANAISAGPLADISTGLLSSSNPVLNAWFTLISAGLVAMMGFIALLFTLRAPAKPNVGEPAA